MTERGDSYRNWLEQKLSKDATVCECVLIFYVIEFFPY